MLNQAKTIEPDLSSDTVRQMKIMVLDDSEVDRKRLLRLCEDAGLTFVGVEVSSIREMQSALAEHSFDLVFIDYLLAGEDGLDAVKHLASDPERSAVSIMIAGEGRVDIAVEAMRRGCSDYITKAELSVASLQKAVATALERQMLSLSIAEERDKRQKLEQAVRRYANECSVEMRTILAGTLRRVRKLRAHSISSDHAEQLGDLEKSIDRLWDALPQFSEGSALHLEQVAAPKLIEKT